MPRTGRPRIQIDQKIFEGLCKIQCTEEEMVSVLGCSADTIASWCKRTYGVTFSETYKKFSADGKASLRRYQFRLAEKSAAMAIFLGKQYLGQKDVVEPTEKNDGILPDLLAFLKDGK